MVEWLAGNRIRGTTAERPALGLPSGSVGGWVEVGRTPWSSGNSFTVSNIPDKRYLMVLNYTDSASNYNNIMRFNSDINLNYAYRRSVNGESPDGTTKIDTNNIGLNAVGYDDFGFSVNYIANLSGKEKLVINHAVDAGGVGSSSDPDRQEVAGKWTGTDPIDEITVTTSSANYNLGETVVLGWDPADTHTTNFWEELANVNGSGSGGFDTGVFSERKYLWVQAYLDPSTSARNNFYFGYNTVDSQPNYANRSSTDGASDGTPETGVTVARGNATSYSTPTFVNMFIINNASNEKLVIGHSVIQNTAGAGTAPNRIEFVSKYANISNQMNIIKAFPSGSANYSTTSQIKVWGSD